MRIAGMFLALMALVFSPLAAPAQDVEATPTPFDRQLDLVEFIDCGAARGSGVRIDGNIVITAYHVVAHRACLIAKEPVAVVYIDAVRDFAVLKTASSRRTYMAYSCDGMQRGRRYEGIGFAYGEMLVEQQYVGTGKKIKSGDFKGLSILNGRSYHGMSGGAVIDRDTNLVVGIVNAITDAGGTYARSLVDTYLCAKDQV